MNILKYKNGRRQNYACRRCGNEFLTNVTRMQQRNMGVVARCGVCERTKKGHCLLTIEQVKPI